MSVVRVVLEGRRDMAGGDCLGGADKPHGPFLGQVLERFPGPQGDPGPLDTKPLHGVVTDVDVHPPSHGPRRGKRVEFGISRIRDAMVL